MMGSPNGTPIPERIMRLTKIRPDGCWEWIGSKNHEGYGVIVLTIGGRIKRRGAHRESYRAFIREPDPLLVLDHLCRNRSCVNPEHLEEVSNAENLARGIGTPVNMPHCIYGHEFTPENTYISHTRKGQTKRVCRACNRRRSAEYKARRIARAAA